MLAGMLATVGGDLHGPTMKVGQRAITSLSQGQGCRGCFEVQMFELACVQVMQGSGGRQYLPVSDWSLKSAHATMIESPFTVG